jgi:hypothetical protein
VAIYALGIIWLRKLARFDMPQRLLGAASTAPGAAPTQGAQGAQGAQPAAEPETVAAWRGA